MLLVPLNQLAGKFVLAYQKNVMKCRDERVALTNEVDMLFEKCLNIIGTEPFTQFLGAIRMIKVNQLSSKPALPPFRNYNVF